MYRFPRLLAVLGVCLAVTLAAVLGAAPANSATTQPARVVASFDAATLSLTPSALLPVAKTETTVARAAREPRQERAFTGGRKAVVIDTEKLPTVATFAMAGERVEMGPPYLR